MTIPGRHASRGRQFRLRGKGMPVLRGGGMHGDLYVEVAVETPVKLSKKQKELLREFEKESNEGTHPESEGFFAKVRNSGTAGKLKARAVLPRVRTPQHFPPATSRQDAKAT